MADLHDLYRRFIDLWHAPPGDIPGLAAGIVGPDFVIHQARVRRASQAVRGPDALARLVRDGTAPFSDVRVQIAVGPLAEGALVAGRWMFEGIYQGGIPGAGAATGTRVGFGGNDVLRADRDRFVEYWVSSDDSHLMAQLAAG